MSDGDAKPVTFTVLTAEEWAARIRDAAHVADRLFDTVATLAGPGQAVLALLLLARSICETNPPLPDFGWYCARVGELVKPGKN